MFKKEKNSNWPIKLRSCQPNFLFINLSKFSETLSCDHTKVTPYYIESITTKAGFWAAPCANLLSYLIGWCDPAEEEYIPMGEDTPHT